jgi:hypothetical protein
MSGLFYDLFGYFIVWQLAALVVITALVISSYANIFWSAVISSD